MTVEDIVELAICSTDFEQFRQSLWDYRREKAKDEAEERLAAEDKEANQ